MRERVEIDHTKLPLFVVDTESRMPIGTPWLTSAVDKYSGIMFIVENKGSCELINTCPFHQCLLVDQCPQCHQQISWSRGGVTKCPCGFDFRSCIPKSASSYQVNLALYLFAIEGDTLCRTRLEKIYGANNPIFELNVRHFSVFSNG